MVSPNVPRAIQVKFGDDKVTAMLTLLKSSHLPSKPPIPTANKWDLGIDIEYLAPLKNKFESEWSVRALEEKVNRYPNYIVPMEDEGTALDLHFVHARSQRTDAVPLILLHGWPGESLPYFTFIPLLFF